MNSLLILALVELYLVACMHIIYLQFGCARPNIVSNDMKPTANGAFLIDTDKRVRFSFRSGPAVGECLISLLVTPAHLVILIQVSFA